MITAFGMLSDGMIPLDLNNGTIVPCKETDAMRQKILDIARQHLKLQQTPYLHIEFTDFPFVRIVGQVMYVENDSLFILPVNDKEYPKTSFASMGALKCPVGKIIFIEELGCIEEYQAWDKMVEFNASLPSC